MGLKQSDLSIIEKARSVGSSDLAIELSDEMCCYLVSIIVHDLAFEDRFPELGAKPPDFFSPVPPENLALAGVDFWDLMERLAAVEGDAVTYFSCLAVMHKARLKYARILERQPIPTLDQVGPRGLLQYGHMSPRAVAGLILWRKWLFDVDNRAAQETAYIFEPIIAHAIGGTPVSHTKSPIRRHKDRTKGRQVDCLRKKRAYELKIRVTIAASGQGRWKEELEFPMDCRTSGHTPVLIVFDPTENDKLTALANAFKKAKGEVYIGDAAWDHLDAQAGKTMATFIEKYVRAPMEAILTEATPDQLPDIRFRMEANRLRVWVAEEELSIYRPGKGDPALATPEDEIPENIDEEMPGA